MNSPKISVHNVIPIRYRSRNNPWIDFIVIAAEDYETQVKNNVFKAIETYYHGNFDDYSDIVEDYLDGLSIPFMVIYRDSENMSQNYVMEWNNTLSMIEVLTDRKLENASLF